MRQTELTPSVLQQIEKAVHSIRYGTVQLTIHDGRVVQLEKVEKVRLGSLSGESIPESQKESLPSDRTSGGSSHHLPPAAKRHLRPKAEESPLATQ